MSLEPTYQPILDKYSMKIMPILDPYQTMIQPTVTSLYQVTRLTECGVSFVSQIHVHFNFNSMQFTKPSGHVYVVHIVTNSSCHSVRIRGWDAMTAKFRTKWTSSFQTENEWPNANTARTIIGSVLMLLCLCVISCKM